MGAFGQRFVLVFTSAFGRTIQVVVLAKAGVGIVVGQVDDIGDIALLASALASVPNVSIVLVGSLNYFNPVGIGLT